MNYIDRHITLEMMIEFQFFSSKNELQFFFKSGKLIACILKSEKLAYLLLDNKLGNI